MRLYFKGKFKHMPTNPHFFPPHIFGFAQNLCRFSSIHLLSRCRKLKVTRWLINRPLSSLHDLFQIEIKGIGDTDEPRLSSQSSVTEESSQSLDNCRCVSRLISFSRRWRCLSAGQPGCRPAWAGKERVHVTFSGRIRAQTALFGSQDLRASCTVTHATCMLSDLEGGEDGGLCQLEPQCCTTAAALSHSVDFIPDFCFGSSSPLFLYSY